MLSRTRDPAQLRRAFNLSQKAVLIWAVPTGLGLAIFATDVVHVILGDRWMPVVPLLEVEGVGEVLNAIATMWAMFYMVQGNNRPAMRLGVQVNIFMLLMIGIAAAAFGYRGVVVTLFATVLITLYRRRRYTLQLFPGIPVLRTAVPLIVAGSLASILSLLLSRYVAKWAYLPQLSLRLACFLGVYAMLALFVERGFFREGWILVRERRLIDEPA